MNKKYISITVFVLVFTLSLSFIAYGNETPIIPLPSGSTTQNEDTSSESTGDDWETPPSDVKVVVDINKCSFSAIANRVYSGKAQTPALTVKYGKTALKKDTDYTLKYANNVKVGAATVTVTGKGDYTGTKKLTFKINPKGASVTKASSPKKKQIKVTWKKQTAQTTGYQIQCSADKNFKKGNKTVTVSKNKTTSKTITKLKSKKKYYVRIRTYKTVKGTKYYSGWKKYSKAIKVK